MLLMNTLKLLKIVKIILDLPNGIISGGLVFSTTYLRGSFAPSAFPRQVGGCGFPH